MPRGHVACTSAAWADQCYCIVLHLGRQFAAQSGCLMMPMNEETLMGRLEELALVREPGGSPPSVRLRAPGDAPRHERRRGRLAGGCVGPTLSAPLLRETTPVQLDERELYRWTKRNSKQRKAVAVERARVVCQALGELLPQAELERLERHLPDLATLFRANETSPRPHSLARMRQPHNDTNLPSSPGLEHAGRSTASAGQSRH